MTTTAKSHPSETTETAFILPQVPLEGKPLMQLRLRITVYLITLAALIYVLVASHPKAFLPG
jgi:hypothetical protein